MLLTDLIWEPCEPITAPTASAGTFTSMTTKRLAPVLDSLSSSSSSSADITNNQIYLFSFDYVELSIYQFNILNNKIYSEVSSDVHYLKHVISKTMITGKGYFHYLKHVISKTMMASDNFLSTSRKGYGWHHSEKNKRSNL